MKKTLVVGASLKSERYSNIAIRRLRSRNYDVVAFGLKEGEVNDVQIDTELLKYEYNEPKDAAKGKMLDTDFLDHEDIQIFALPSDVNFIDIGVPIDYERAQFLIPRTFGS